MRVVAMIPARYNASRLPGKLLLDLAGMPVIQRTYQSVLESELFDEVYVVTDSKEIQTLIENIGGSVFFSKKNHVCGTDRIAEFATETKAEIIINVQGDEPFVDKKSLKNIINVFFEDKKKEIDLASTMQIIDNNDLKNPNKVKVLVDENNFALDFYRLNTNYLKREAEKIRFFKHLGVYGFRLSSLMDFYNSEPTLREKNEKLEQLRYLERGKKIKMILTNYKSVSIDVMDDLVVARKIINAYDS